MSYEHLIRYALSQPWAIEESKLDEIVMLMVRRLDGHRLTSEEVRAVVGEDMERNKAKHEAAAEIAAASRKRARGGAVAVVPILGTIFHRAATLEESSGGTSTQMIRQGIRDSVDDQEVGTILLDVDSPGGGVDGVQETADEIFRAREKKRVVALADVKMASAAYWLASQADEIIGVPSSRTGSIGVIGMHEDLSKRAELLGVNITLLSAGKFKTEGNPFEPLSEEGRAFFQSQVNMHYDNFVGAVARGRGVSVSAVKSGFGEGRALPAKDAKEAGLIDRTATRDEAISQLVRKGGGQRTAANELRARRLRI